MLEPAEHVEPDDDHDGGDRQRSRRERFAHGVAGVALSRVPQFGQSTRDGVASVPRSVTAIGAPQPPHVNGTDRGAELELELDRLGFFLLVMDRYPRAA